jgi:acetolactate synthase I/III small subunit
MFAAASARLAPRAFAPRLLSTTARRAQPPSSSRPPRPIHDSTSALDYKSTQRHAPPPLPEMDIPRTRTAEEAVTNILYNTPPPSMQPYKK